MVCIAFFEIPKSIEKYIKIEGCSKTFGDEYEKILSYDFLDDELV
jgi:hypothetical protein